MRCVPVAGKCKREHDARKSPCSEYRSARPELSIPSKRKKTVAPALRSASPALDRTNLAILRQLTAEPGLAIRELARRVDMSPPAVSERVLRLKETGDARGRGVSPRDR